MDICDSGDLSPPRTPSCEPSMKLPAHVCMVKNRLGRPYYYLQRNRGTERATARLRLPDDPRSPEFWAAYAEAMGKRPVREPTGTFALLIDAWRASDEWNRMALATRRLWTMYCDRMLPAIGAVHVKELEPHHVLELRDHLYRGKPASGNNLIRCLSAMIAWGVPRRWRNDNPCREIKPLKGGDGYEHWPPEVISAARAELIHNRLDLWWSVALALYTGQRKGDVLRMRWDDISGGMIAVRQQKTGKRLAVPIHRDLAAILAEIPRRAVTILTDRSGVPWTLYSHGGAWTDYRPAATRGLVFHGLRKSAVVTLLEAGCTDAEVSAITGQSREIVAHYAKGVNQRKLAVTAMGKWEAIANTVVNISDATAKKAI